MPRVPQQQQQQTNMEEIKKGAWSPEEDQKLKTYIMRYGIWNWRQMPKFAGLSRTGKSCRLRWMNYLRPGVKRGPFSMEEVEIVIKMYHEFGNRWSTIAARLPGRTDNEVKNFFHTHLKKHLGVKNDASVKTKGRRKRVINEKRNADKSQERSVLGTTNYSSSLLSSDVASPCSSIITCEENQMMDIMNFSETFQGCRNVSSLVDQPVILESNPDTSGDIGVTDCQSPKLKMENSVILENNAEIFEDVGVAHCQLRQFEYSQPCSIFDNSIFNSDQFDLKSFWFDVIGDPEHLIF